MTRATMYWNRMRFEMEGHAGGGPFGQDLICAAESMLVSALVGALEDAQDRGRCTMDYEEKDGSTMVWADPVMGCSNEIRAYFRMCVKGFKMLKEEYPGNVKIEEVH